MFSQTRLRRSKVAAVLIAVMAVSVTGLFGATGASVKITSPKSGARVSGEITVSTSVKASSVAYLILVVDGERPCVTNSRPYRFNLDTRMLADGPHKISVEAYDSFGMIASSRAITIAEAVGDEEEFHAHHAGRGENAGYHRAGPGARRPPPRGSRGGRPGGDGHGSRHHVRARAASGAEIGGRQPGAPGPTAPHPRGRQLPPRGGGGDERDANPGTAAAGPYHHGGRQGGCLRCRDPDR